jgi:hypothetical protein
MITRNLKSQLWALFTQGGGVTYFPAHIEHKEGEYVVHEDQEDKSIWVLLFEDLTHAQYVACEYKVSTGNSCEIQQTLVRGLDDDQNIRLYRMDGSWQDYVREEYINQLKQKDTPSFWEKSFPDEEED